jgi:hypothetical protein
VGHVMTRLLRSISASSPDAAGSPDLATGGGRRRHFGYMVSLPQAAQRQRVCCGAAAEQSHGRGGVSRPGSQVQSAAFWQHDASAPVKEINPHESAIDVAESEPRPSKSGRKGGSDVPIEMFRPAGSVGRSRGPKDGLQLEKHDNLPPQMFVARDANS